MIPLRSRVNSKIDLRTSASWLFALVLVIVTMFRSRFAYSNFVLPDFYHTTEEISEKLQELEARCPDMSIRRESVDAATSIEIVSISRHQLVKKEGKTKFFILAGEHARELIAPESALHFVAGKCFL